RAVAELLPGGGVPPAVPRQEPERVLQSRAQRDELPNRGGAVAPGRRRGPARPGRDDTAYFCLKNSTSSATAGSTYSSTSYKSMWFVVGSQRNRFGSPARSYTFRAASGEQNPSTSPCTTSNGV